MSSLKQWLEEHTVRHIPKNSKTNSAPIVTSLKGHLKDRGEWYLDAETAKIMLENSIKENQCVHPSFPRKYLLPVEDESKDIGDPDRHCFIKVSEKLYNKIHGLQKDTTFNETLGSGQVLIREGEGEVPLQ